MMETAVGVNCRVAGVGEEKYDEKVYGHMSRMPEKRWIIRVSK